MPETNGGKSAKTAAQTGVVWAKRVSEVPRNRASPELAQAFTQLFRTSHNDLLAFAKGRVGSQLAPDAVSTSYEVLLGRWHAGRLIDCDSLRASAFCAVKWTTIHQLEDKVHQDRLAVRLSFALAPHGLCEEPTAAIEASMVATELLNVLPPAERRAVDLMVLGGFSSVEAARSIGCTPGAVTMAKSRALARLNLALSAR